MYGKSEELERDSVRAKVLFMWQSEERLQCQQQDPHDYFPIFSVPWRLRYLIKNLVSRDQMDGREGNSDIKLEKREKEWQIKKGCIFKWILFQTACECTAQKKIYVEISLWKGFHRINKARKQFISLQVLLL